VIWSSILKNLPFIPEDGDGVVVVGKLNFWQARATLSVQILDLRPSLGAVLRQFERVRSLLEPEGLFAPQRKRSLPSLPARIALLTSVPSSALADMLRTAKERWPLTALIVIPIPVQGAAEQQILATLDALSERVEGLGIECVVLARGGGSREDLAVFDSEALARALAGLPVPVVCGLGHEDDVTIADLVADHRAATPTAAIVALLPDRHAILQTLALNRQQLRRLVVLRLRMARQKLQGQRQQLLSLHPRRWLQRQREWLRQQRRLIQAISPQHLLERGFSLVRDERGQLVRSIQCLKPEDAISIQVLDGRIMATVTALGPPPEVLNPP
jgi:exodeoxyribonuclease VII large subunit